MALGEDRIAFAQAVAQLDGPHRTRSVARRKLARRIAFENAADFGRLIAVLMAEVAHRIAALAGGLEQSFGGKRRQRVAHGRSRYAQPLGNGGLGDARAGRQHAFDNQLADALRYAAVHAPPLVECIE